MTSSISLNSALGYTSPLTNKSSVSSTSSTSAADLLKKANDATVSGTTSTADTGKSKSVAQQFLDYMNMSDEDKLKYSLLNQMGISKDQYDSMPADQKADVDKKIADRMTQIAQTQNQSGGANQGVAGQVQSYANNASAGDKKIPLIDFSV